MRRPILLAAALVVVVLAVVFAVVSRSDQSNVGTGEVSDPALYGVYVPAGPVQQISTDVSALEGSVTPGADLSGVDARRLYWAMLKRQSMKTVTDYVFTTYPTERDYQVEYPGALSTRRVAIDYEKRQFIDETAQLTDDGEVDAEAIFTRCVDGNTFYYSDQGDGPSAWEAGDQALDETLCSNRLKPKRAVENSFTSDGVATGGLTSQEADRFVSYLVNTPGLFTMRTPQVVEGDDGQTYLQMDVRLNQIDPQLPQNPENFAAGAEFLDRVHENEEWPCWERGEQDDLGTEITSAGECRGTDNVNQPYQIIVTLGHETDTGDDRGTMNEVTMTASTAAVLERGEDVTNEINGEIMDMVVRIGLENLWPDHKDWRNEALDLIAKVRQEGCEEGEVMSLGYEVTCRPPGEPIVVEGSNGPVKTISEDVRISGPSWKE